MDPKPPSPSPTPPLRRSQSAKSTATKQGTSSRGPFQCDFCDQSFSSPTRKSRHQFTHFGYPYNCPISSCNKGFLHNTNLTEHLEKIHRIKLNLDPLVSSSEKREGTKEFCCPLENCRMSFQYLTTLNNHMETYHGNKGKGKEKVGGLGLGMNQLGESQSRLKCFFSLFYALLKSPLNRR